jgi:hypothetical protein
VEVDLGQGNMDSRSAAVVADPSDHTAFEECKRLAGRERDVRVRVERGRMAGPDMAATNEVLALWERGTRAYYFAHTVGQIGVAVGGTTSKPGEGYCSPV